MSEACGPDGRCLSSRVGTSVLEAGVRLCVDLAVTSLRMDNKGHRGRKEYDTLVFIINLTTERQLRNTMPLLLKPHAYFCDTLPAFSRNCVLWFWQGKVSFYCNFVCT